MNDAPKRRWFRFSLRTLLAVVTVLACGAGWLAWRWNRRYERMMLLSTPGVTYMSDSWGEVQSVSEIDVGPEVPDDVFEQLRRTFPEAQVRRGSGARLPYSMHMEYEPGSAPPLD